MDAFLTAHPRGSKCFLWSFAVLIGCATFPAFPVTGAPWELWWLGPLTALWAYREIGRMQAALYPGRSGLLLAAMALGLALAGLLCRFLLEYGEASNSVNFTAPNVLLHLLLAVGLPALTAWQATVHGVGGQGNGT